MVRRIKAIFDFQLCVTLILRNRYPVCIDILRREVLHHNFNKGSLIEIILTITRNWNKRDWIVSRIEKFKACKASSKYKKQPTTPGLR